MGGNESTVQARTDPAWVDEVLRFWFVELQEADWFRKDGALDARIRERFLALHERLASGDGVDPRTPRAALATVIALDQFPRNMFRDDPRAYATDALALRTAKDAIARGFDAALSPRERLFLYLPLEHSEHLDDQHRACELVASLGNADWTRYAEAHRAIIERFGRFPHRNAVLGRVSTPEELALLESPMGRF